MTLPDINFNLPVYGLNTEQKRAFLTEQLLSLTQHHYQHCAYYKNFIDALCSQSVNPQSMNTLEQIPALAASLFKYYSLKSIADDDVFKRMHSSGTSGAELSTIALDRSTAQLQTKALGKILQSVVGRQRLPTLIVDHNQLLNNKSAFSARGAGVQGLSMFGRDQTHVLNQDMTLNWLAFDQFYERYRDTPVMMFGFTFMVWLHLLKQIKASRRQYDFSKLYLIHSGGWKKLRDQAVSNEVFASRAQELLGKQTAVHNFYGMVEQTGSIYMACEQGHLHAPVYADIRIRHSRDYSLLAAGETGLIETLSVLPRSYPGHVLLTQDIGRIDGEDDCPCGRLGRYFTVFGRQQQAETRGCSDSYEYR